MSDGFGHFVADQHDRTAQAHPGPHPDEEQWALLDDGLISPEDRDALVEHAASCSDCRRRLGAIISEWTDEVMIPASAEGVFTTEVSAAGSVAEPEAEAQAQDKPVSSERSTQPLLLRLARSTTLRYAAAACVVLGVSVFLYIGPKSDIGAGLTTAQWIRPDAALTELGAGLGAGRRADPEVTLGEDEYRAALQTLQEDMPHPRALELAARAALTARFFDEAMEYAARWVEVMPDDPGAHNALGLALFNTGQFDKAYEHFAEAIRLGGDRPAYELNAALSADSADRTERAIQHIRRFKQIAPTDPRIPEIDRWLKRLGAEP